MTADTDGDAAGVVRVGPAGPGAGELADRLALLGQPAVLGLTGSPGAGKSTLAAALAAAHGGVVVPLDGFHLADLELTRRGLLRRKGAPETFDALGYLHLLQRVRAGDEEVLAPTFERERDLARAAAIVVAPHHRVVLTEGNYLLLDADPWRRLAGAFDLSVFLDVPPAELERRLVQRWLDHGLAPAQARARARGNDLANARVVLERSRAADLRLAN